jgi:hypothetical protein
MPFFAKLCIVSVFSTHPPAVPRHKKSAERLMPPGVGVFFVPVDDPSKAVKVSRVAENTPSKITGIAVDTGYAYNRIEIRTQFAGSGANFLKTPRTITSNFVLEHA